MILNKIEIKVICKNNIELNEKLCWGYVIYILIPTVGLFLQLVYFIKIFADVTVLNSIL